jgi:hypothetical protein
MNLEEMELELRPYYERKKKELGDSGASGSVMGTAAHSALGLGDGGARARGQGRQRLGSGTVAHSALGLGDGDGDARARARARGRGRRQPGGATVSARAGRVRVPAGTNSPFIL